MSEAEKRSSAFIGALAILLVAIATIVPTINTRDLWEPEELRYAEVTREMMERNDWALLTCNYRNYPDKPPLFYWAIMLSSKLYGRLDHISARTVNITCGILCILFMYLFARGLVGNRGALLGGFVLIATPFFAWTSGEARMDTMLTMFIILALWTFWENYNREKQSWLLAIGFGVFCGLGTMTKGPVAFVLPFLTALCFSLYERKPRRFLNRYLVVSIIVGSAIVLPWLTLACLRGGEAFTRNILFKQNIGRFAGGYRHKRPVYHFFPVVPGILMPWTLLLPAAVVNIKKAEDDKRRGLWFLLIWFLVVFIFFTICRGKRTIYMVPLVPAAAMLVGSALDRMLTLRERGERFLTAEIGFLFIPVVLLMLAPIIPFGPAIARSEALRPLAKQWDMLVEIGWGSIASYAKPAAIACAVGVVGMIACLIVLFLGRVRGAVACAVGTIVACYITGTTLMLPLVNQQKSAKVMLKKLSNIIKPDEPLTIYLSHRAGYNFYWKNMIRTIPGEEDLLTYLSSPQRRFCLGLTKDWGYGPLAFEGRAFIVWVGRCGGRLHVLLTNHLPIEDEKEAKKFLLERKKSSCVELRDCVFLLSDAKGEMADADVLHLKSVGTVPLLRLYPKKGVSGGNVIILADDIDMGDYNVSVEALKGGKKIEIKIEEAERGVRLTVPLTAPCEIRFVGK